MLAKKNKLKISKIENPHPGLQPLAEVERFHLQFKNIFVVNRKKFKSTRKGEIISVGPLENNSGFDLLIQS